MNTKIFRTKKSEFILSTFYFLTFFVLMTYVFIFSRTVLFGLSDVLRNTATNEMIIVLIETIKTVSLSFLIAFPLVFLLTIFLVLCGEHPLGKQSEKFLKFLAKVPLIISCLPIIFWLRNFDPNVWVVGIFVFVVLPRWTLRLFGVTQKVRPLTLEASLSIGMGFWQVLYYIYLKKCWKDFVQQSSVMFISVLGLISPFFYLLENFKDKSGLISFTIFHNIIDDPLSTSLVSTLVLALMLFSFVNVMLGYSKQSYGEWNG